ncbi:MAG: hypothetical protein ABSD39_10030 [Terriglobales bacterium]
MPRLDQDTTGRMQDADRIRERDNQPKGSWNRLRVFLKDVFAELGGGEAYLRGERDNLHS